VGDLLTGGDAKRRDEQLLDDAFEVLDEAAEIIAPRAWVALFSGGHDSLTATTVAFEWARARDVPLTAAHIRTGTGIPATTEYVKEVCAAQGWPLKIYDPPVPYEDIVLEYGFMGPGQHGIAYNRLKERCLRQIVREAKVEYKDRIAFVTPIAGHLWAVAYDFSAVGPLAVVPDEPRGEGYGAFVGRVVRPDVGPKAEHCLDETLCLAVGSRGVRTGSDVPCTQRSDGPPKFTRDVRRAVVAHDAFEAPDAMPRIEGRGTL